MFACHDRWVCTLGVRPVPLLSQNISLSPPGRLPEGVTRIPFSFPLESNVSAAAASPLFETFHGANVQIMYAVSAEVVRPVLRGGSLGTGLCEFLVETRADVDGAQSVASATPLRFDITEEGQELGPGAGALLSKGFSVKGWLDKSAWFVEEPLTGWIKIDASPVRVISVDLELCRMEGCTTSEGQNVSETSTIQFTQIADGNVSLGLQIPIYVMFPRLYCCPSLQARTFSVSFMVRIMVVFASSNPGGANPIAVKTLPIRLVRGDINPVL